MELLCTAAQQVAEQTEEQAVRAVVDRLFDPARVMIVSDHDVVY